MVDDNLDESCTVPLLCVGTLQPSRKNFCGPFQAFALNPCHCHCKCCEALTKCVPRCMQLCMDTGHSTWCLCRTLLAGLIYVQLKSGNSIYRTLTLPLDRDPFLSQIHRRGITCRLTFDGF